MDVSQLPFNRLIGLELADQNSGFLVYLPDHPQYTNHLGTVHGSALMAVAEAASGAFLSEHFKDMPGLIPVVRRLETKFRRPASGKVSARCKVEPHEIARWSSDLASRGRLSVSLAVEVVDASDLVVMSADVEWFVTRNTSSDQTSLAEDQGSKTFTND